MNNINITDKLNITDKVNITKYELLILSMTFVL